MAGSGPWTRYHRHAEAHRWPDCDLNSRGQYLLYLLYELGCSVRQYRRPLLNNRLQLRNGLHTCKLDRRRALGRTVVHIQRLTRLHCAD